LRAAQAHSRFRTAPKMKPLVSAPPVLDRFAALAGLGVARLAAADQTSPAWALGAAVLGGWLAADLLSGVVHWALDTFGSVRTPFLGPRFIRPFREHHVDADAILRHDFAQTNGASCLAALPLLAASALLPTASPGDCAIHVWLLCTALGVLLTNQTHKWAHMPPDGVPRAVRLAQRYRLVLRREAHLRHHRRPFDSHYCTASGWLNAPLERTGFFRALERCVRTLAPRGRSAPASRCGPRA
jgi:ubiquitin-conjugating enzyme E2 variant